jgi:hypothetical protein
MLPSRLKPEPSTFDTMVRQPGQRWLASHPTGKLQGRWTTCAGDLADAFDCLCAYSAMFCEEDGAEVDHYHPTSTHRHLAYEWSNYRHAAAKVNRRKQAQQVLDPFTIGAGWFAIRLPDLHAYVTTACPTQHSQSANDFLDILALRNGSAALRQRQRRMRDYFLQSDLFWLERTAPLLAHSVQNTSPALMDQMRNAYAMYPR